MLLAYMAAYYFESQPALRISQMMTMTSLFLTTAKSMSRHGLLVLLGGLPANPF